ncbi:MAG: MFS transporter [Candidatus Dormibacteraeota bacterium]|uniref:MFS transporter n=1 Tax=Candidatus Amunia macphersoniae TaxID=3127014 RepID=A0A934NGB0_9BACT|nr:MFS transporter [Candidatus Dormibacteraeota bacterium]
MSTSRAVQSTVAAQRVVVPADVAEAVGEPAGRHRWLLIALAVGAFISMADATIVAVALDPMVHHFAVPLSAGQEVLSVYLVAITATLPTLGRLGDRLGRRRVYLAGFAVFAAGSVMAALAPSFGWLLATRAIQAVGGGVLTAGSLTLIAQHAPRGRTGRAVAVLVITQALAGLAGPPLGGILVAIGGWQAIFWAGLPMAAVGAALAIRFVPGGEERRTVTVDIPGSILTATLLLGLGAGIASIGGPVVGNAGPEVWFAVAWISLLLLVPTELIARRPVIDGRLLRNSRFAAATMATLLSTGTLMSCFALLPYWLEQAHGAAPIVAGLAFVPIAVGIGATSRRGGKLSDAGRTQVSTATGMGLAATGLALAALAAHLDAWWLLLVGLLVLGLGNGYFSSPNTSAAIRVAPGDALGSAAGFLSTARNAGVIIGLAVTGAVYTSSVHGSTASADAVAMGIFAVAAAVCVVVAALTARTYRDRSVAG